MVYQVCALVAAIIFGVIGIEFMLWLRSARHLTDEAAKTVKEINKHIPQVLDNVQTVTSVVRLTSEQIGGTVNEVAVSLEELRRNPLSLVTAFMVLATQLVDLWQGIRGRQEEAE